MAAKSGAQKKAESATRSVKKATGRMATSAKESGRRATGTVKASRAASAGRIVEAKQIAADVDVTGLADKAIEAAEALHYEAVVNKRGLSVAGLTKKLNERWENGWRLAHALEQRGNTVLIFEKRT